MSSDSEHWRKGARRHLIARPVLERYATADLPRVVGEARAQGATDVDVAVNMTRDGVLVAIATNMVPVPGHEIVRWTSQTTFDELRAAAPGDELLRVADVLDVVADTDLGLYLDVAQLLPGGAASLGAMVRERGLVDRTVAASRRTDLVGRLKTEGQLATSLMVRDPFVDVHSIRRGLDIDFVHASYAPFGAAAESLLEPGWVAAVLALGLGLIGWTTEDVDVAADLYGRGVDAVCSREPAVLVEAMARLG